jgi:excisionase family DNA binding protein
MSVSSLRTEQPPRSSNYDSPYLSIQEVADYLSVSRRTVLYWVSAGEIPTLELPGRIRRFDREAIDKWVRSRAVPARAGGRRR